MSNRYLSHVPTTYVIPRDVFKKFCARPEDEPCQHLSAYVNLNGDVSVSCNKFFETGERCLSVEALIFKEEPH